MYVWATTPVGAYLVREGLFQRWPRDVVFIFNWLLMCTAMMLPTTLPLLSAFQRTLRGRPDAKWLLSASMVGFLAAWCIAGVILRVAQVWLFEYALPSAWVRQHHSDIAACLLALGGGYLLLPVAQQCASACKSPVGFIAQSWTGRANVHSQALRVGLRYGISCFGCCWPVMLAMLVMALSGIAWMLVLTLVMLLQKQSAHSALWGRIMAVVLLGLAGLVWQDFIKVPLMGNGGFFC
jgi:predicted metal-binding membrane protein